LELIGHFYFGLTLFLVNFSSEECKIGDGDELATSGTRNEMCDKARKEYVQCEHPHRAMHKNDL